MPRNRKIIVPDSKTSGRILPPPVSAEQRIPAFGFYATAPGYGIADASPDDRLDFLEAIRKRSEMTWAQLHSTHHERLGLETIPRGIIRAPIPNHVTLARTLYSLRVRGRATLQRIIGYRDENTFVIVWLDCDGSVYDHGS